MIDDIVKQAGVSRGTFYTHFDTVEQAIADAGAMLADEMVADVRLIFEGLDDAVMRTATGTMTFLVRAMVDPQWGGFVARAGVLREENILSRDIRADIALGVKAGRYSVQNTLAATDLIFGVVVEAILRINQGHRSVEYIRAMSGMILVALGVSKVRARRAVDESFNRLVDGAGSRVSWWMNPNTLAAPSHASGKLDRTESPTLSKPTRLPKPNPPLG